MSKGGLLSVVILSYRSEKKLGPACERLIKKLESEKIPFEIVIVDDGSPDNSFSVARRLAKNDPRIRAYRLSKNYTSPYTQFAGMELSKGDCVVTVPDDLQRPPSLVVDMYRKWQDGEKIVIGYRKSRRDGKLNDWFSNAYYRLMNTFSEVRFPPGGADGFLADREVVDILVNRIHPINTSTVVEVLRLGFEPYYLPYDRPGKSGKSRWTTRKKIRLALDTFFASSSFPIRAITVLGFVMFFLSLIVVLLIVYGKLFTDNTLFGFPIQGWATTISIITLFNGLTLLCLGIVAEYIWRIFEEVKDRPGYIIRQDDEEE